MATPNEIEACRDEYGDAHDDQVAFAGECGWCGYYDPSIKPGYIDELTGNVYAANGDMIEQHTFEENR